MTYWHIILELPKIGLLEKGSKEEIAQKLRMAVIKQLGEMSLDTFLSYCRVDQRNILPYRVDDGVMSAPKQELNSSFELPEWMKREDKYTRNKGTD